MQNDLYNGDVYYKRETPSVRYALRGYNNNWHFPTTINKSANTSGWKSAGEACPYDGVFRAHNIGQMPQVVTEGKLI